MQQRLEVLVRQVAERQRAIDALLVALLQRTRADLRVQQMQIGLLRPDRKQGTLQHPDHDGRRQAKHHILHIDKVAREDVAARIDNVR